MSNANRDYAIVYDVKNSSLVLGRPLNFYITDKNTSNIFIKLVTRVTVGNGIDQYTDIENASNYVLTMRVIKPNNEVKSLEATQHEPENIFQFDLTEDFKDIPGKYICELTISTIVSSRQELITSDPFNYEVKRSILSNVGEIIETEDTTVEKLLNNLDATKAELSSRIKDKVNKGEITILDIDKNKGKFDQTYMTEEFLQQIAGNTPINSIPAKGSITDDMFSRPYAYGEPGKNLFNKNACEIGKYVTDTGGIDTNADYCASHFIKVIPTESYFLAVTESWNCQFCYYDANQNFVSLDKTKGGVFTIPENCYYVRFTFKPVDLNTIQFEKGTKQTQYEEYKVGLPSKSVNINNLSDDLLPLIEGSSKGGYRVVCKKNGTELIVGFKYNSNEDFRILFKPCGQSNLPQINNIYKLDNTVKLPSSDFSNYGTLFQTASSDWVGPYICRTSNNNGDKPDSWEFTGGWHGFNGDQSGSATARNVSTKYYIDNIEIVDDSTNYGNEIKIIVVNNIQSTDTKKENGGGRECLQETIIYTITPNNVNVDVEIKALENVKITTYYGLQTVNNSYDGQILYVDDESMIGWTDCAYVKIDGGTKTNSDCGEYKLKKDNDLLIAWIDKSYGLGKRKYVNADKPLVWTADYNKSYMVLVNGNLDLITNQILNWRGGYKFISLI